MSTKMTEKDWRRRCMCFAPRFRVGATKAVTTGHFWRRCTISRSTTSLGGALPARFGKWNSLSKRFDRLSKAGVFATFFEHLAALSSSAHLIQMFDSAVVRAHVSAAGAKGAERPGARPLARPLLHQNSSEDRLRRPSDRLRPDRRRNRRRTALHHSARARSRCRSEGGRSRQGLRQQGQPAGGAVTQRHPRHLELTEMETGGL